MATPVVLVDSGGIAITESPYGTPFTPVDVSIGGFAVTLVPSGGIPVVLVNEDLSAYSAMLWDDGDFVAWDDGDLMAWDS